MKGPDQRCREISGLHAWRDDFLPALRLGHGVLRFVPRARNRPLAISLSGTAGVTACHSCGRLTVPPGHKHRMPSGLGTRPCEGAVVRLGVATPVWPLV